MNTLSVGDKVKFAEEKQRYTVQAAGERYAVCTKPFNPMKTVLYTIVDAKEKIRGTESLILQMGAETREDCEEMLARLEGRCDTCFGPTEVSYRNRILLKIESVSKAKEQSK